MKYYGIIITEIQNEDSPGGFWGPFRMKYHKENEICKIVLKEEDFKFKTIFQGIYQGMKGEEPHAEKK